MCIEFGLTPSIPKTMHLMTGRETVGSDQSPIKVNGGEINSVDEFQYLGSRIAASGRMDGDVGMRIAQALELLVHSARLSSWTRTSHCTPRE